MNDPQEPRLKLYVRDFSLDVARDILLKNMKALRHTAWSTRYMVCVAPCNNVPVARFEISVHVVKLEDLFDVLPNAVAAQKAGGSAYLFALSSENDELQEPVNFFDEFDNVLHRATSRSAAVIASLALQVAIVAFLMICRHVRNHPTPRVKYVHGDEVKY